MGVFSMKNTLGLSKYKLRSAMEVEILNLLF